MPTQIRYNMVTRICRLRWFFTILITNFGFLSQSNVLDEFDRFAFCSKLIFLFSLRVQYHLIPHLSNRIVLLVSRGG